jgi:hypothetical protein
MRRTTRNGRKDSICDRMANVASVKMTAQRKRDSGRVRSRVTAGREKNLIAENQRWDAWLPVGSGSGFGGPLCNVLAGGQAPLIVDWLNCSSHRIGFQ